MGGSAREAPLALTMGDPAGVGPDITIDAWRALRTDGPAFAVIADPTLYTQRGAAVAALSHWRDAPAAFADALPVIAPPASAALSAPVTPGAPDARHAAAILASIEHATHAALSRDAAAVVTNPIAKHVLYEAGFSQPGHTEYLAALTAAAPEAEPRGPVMMLAGGGLRVALATIHLPLSEVPEALTPERLERVIGVTARCLRRDFAIDQPRLALAGLNPHAGEGGTLGHEETHVLNPLAARLRAQGLAISDAQPADALFAPHARMGYDAVIAMYHDQGLIPVKTLDFDGGVNITLGLPITRTSPDHGAAFSIAGTGRARADSLIAALRQARAIADRRAVHAAHAPQPA